MNSNIWNGAGRRIYMQEVGTRDGLQVEAAFVPTEDKIALVNALSQAGMAKIEVTSFVSPKAIPALRDGEIVLREIERKPGVIYSALVPNVRGAERAIDANTDEFNLVMSASETHNLANLRMTRAQSYAALSDVNALARQAKAVVNVSLSCSFGCPMEGDVPVATVLDWCARFVERDGRARRHLVRHHRHGLPGPGGRVDAGLPRALAGHRTDPALPQHARSGPRQRAGGDRCRRRPLRCVARRHRRLPVCARRHRQRVQRGDRACARADGLRHRCRLCSA